MSSQYCRLCRMSVYRVTPDYVDEYVCLNKGCCNFKISFPESKTLNDICPQVSGEGDYPISPLLYCPSPTLNQSRVTQPSPQQHAHTAVTQPVSASETDSAEPPQPPHTKARATKIKDIPILETPLSEQPNKSHVDPMTVIAKHANRSVEERRRETGADGKVRKPLNPWILYRKAYSAVKVKVKVKGIEKYALPNTSLLAQSWSMESNSVTKYFSDLAGIDRSLHMQAFPDYKVVRRPAHGDDEELE